MIREFKINILPFTMKAISPLGPKISWNPTYCFICLSKPSNEVHMDYKTCLSQLVTSEQSLYRRSQRLNECVKSGRNPKPFIYLSCSQHIFLANQTYDACLILKTCT